MIQRESARGSAMAANRLGGVGFETSFLGEGFRDRFLRAVHIVDCEVWKVRSGIASRSVRRDSVHREGMSW